MLRLTNDPSQIPAGLSLRPETRLAFVSKPRPMDEHIRPLVEHFSKLCQVKKFEVTQPSQIDQAMDWADLCWFEWCDELIGYASHHPRHCGLICRLHRYEAYTNLPKAVRWENVDLLIASCNDHVIQALQNKTPLIEQQVRIVQIPNAVDLNVFSFRAKAKGYNLVCPGDLNLRKNPMFLLQCFKELLGHDSNYMLHFSGQFQDEMLAQYFQYLIERLDLQNNIRFSKEGENQASWFEDQHYFLAAAVGEGHPFDILEAMAVGLKPVIHNFPGAETFYPRKYIYNTVHDFCQIILEDDYNPPQTRNFIERHHSLEDHVRVLAALLAQVANQAQTRRHPVQAAETGTPGKIDQNGLIMEEKAVDFVSSFLSHPDFKPLGDFDGLNLWDCNFLWLINQLTAELSAERN